MDHKTPINYFYTDNIKSTDFCPDNLYKKREKCFCPTTDLKLLDWANSELFLADQDGRRETTFRD